MSVLPGRKARPAEKKNAFSNLSGLMWTRPYCKNSPYFLPWFVVHKNAFFERNVYRVRKHKVELWRVRDIPLFLRFESASRERDCFVIYTF